MVEIKKQKEEYNMSKIKEICNKGYTFVHGFAIGNRIIPVNDDYIVNKYHLIIIKPNGSKVSLASDLDLLTSIGGIETTPREIIQEFFNPTEEDWCLYEKAYNDECKAIIDYSNKIRINVIEV